MVWYGMVWYGLSKYGGGGEGGKGGGLTVAIFFFLTSIANIVTAKCKYFTVYT